MTNDEIRQLEAEADAYQAQADADREAEPYRKAERLERELAAERAKVERLMGQVCQAQEALGMPSIERTLYLAGEILATLSIEANKKELVGHPNMVRMVGVWQKQLAALSSPPAAQPAPEKPAEPTLCQCAQFTPSVYGPGCARCGKPEKARKGMAR